MNAEQLKDILNKHKKWLLNENGGERADLSGANLSRADLSGANLSGAYLPGAYMSRAYLSGANLSGANLSGANLSRAYLSRAYLSRADLSGANLSGANLSGANLSGAYLSRADLSRADLSGANLSRAYLSGADLYGAKIETELLNKFLPICCPEYGSFTGWKKANGGYIVKLEITESAKRSSAYGRKCRCSEAKVLAIENADGSTAAVKEASSQHDPDFVYRIGETVRVDDFDEDRRNECAPGIHFFITRQEAVSY